MLGQQLIASAQRVVVGQSETLELLWTALLAGGHVLLEGVPGVAKTLMASTLARLSGLQFARVQFTPDMLPSDLIGGVVYEGPGRFSEKKGPIFTQVLLADEINRAPAKVQSALLEAMQEGQVTLGEKTFDLPKPFWVIATQNPIEQEGTYALPEAQIDRFLFRIEVSYPTEDEELRIVQQWLVSYILNRPPRFFPLQRSQPIRKRWAGKSRGRLERYIVTLVRATRDPGTFGLKSWVGKVAYGLRREGR